MFLKMYMYWEWEFFVWEYDFLIEDTVWCRQRKEIKSLPVSHLSIFFFFPAWESIHLRQKKPYSASETWARGYCSMEQGISCGKWRPKSILQPELLTTYRIKNPGIYQSQGRREESRDERERGKVIREADDEMQVSLIVFYQIRTIKPSANTTITIPSSDYNWKENFWKSGVFMSQSAV